MSSFRYERKKALSPTEDVDVGIHAIGRHHATGPVRDLSIRRIMVIRVLAPRLARTVLVRTLRTDDTVFPRNTWRGRMEVDGRTLAVETAESSLPFGGIFHAKASPDLRRRIDARNRDDALAFFLWVLCRQCTRGSRGNDRYYHRDDERHVLHDGPFRIPLHYAYIEHSFQPLQRHSRVRHRR